MCVGRWIGDDKEAVAGNGEVAGHAGDAPVEERLDLLHVPFLGGVGELFDARAAGGWDQRDLEQMEAAWQAAKKKGGL